MKIPFENAPFYHYVLEILAFFIGMRFYFYLKKKNRIISDENRLWILLGAMIGAFIGSRFIAVLETPSLIHKMSFLTVFQSKTVAGGFFGGLFGVEIIKKIIGEKKASGDLYVYPIIVALIIGRIGCFGMGIKEPTYGIETSFFTGINLGDEKQRHPVVLYEITFLICLIFLFNKLKNVDLINGDRFKLFFLLYFLYRFFIEFLKPYESLILKLSIIHWISIFIFIYYYHFIIRIIKKILNAH
ncbi:prolipoprotein diacylglyceryl transferase family protein [Flavobacterium covae]|uniref:prolipoprotein diacylglyceryl transferase family protein n=1 Tax=Flavobacterium covae TaxID=2906076 RepID=UPI000B5BB129|nr:prolipoprotein diacylglyceryl transferase family protein [Flavobacterium covae]MCJ1806940.1 prolipoprotein diacylglyceryl transferase [Flavobacterium covae]OXA76357.1 diacylglyceryl transferase [Flavobacterium columnare] [Flavobacterium columnare NBRC 100251 = ATCC 23463]